MVLHPPAVSLPLCSFHVSTPYASHRRRSLKSPSSHSGHSLPLLSLVAPPSTFAPLVSPSSSLLFPHVRSPSHLPSAPSLPRAPSAPLSAASRLRVSAPAFSPSRPSTGPRRSSSVSPTRAAVAASAVSRPTSRSVPSSPSPSVSTSPVLSSFFSSNATPSLASLLAQSWSVPASPSSAKGWGLEGVDASDVWATEEDWHLSVDLEFCDASQPVEQ